MMITRIFEILKQLLKSQSEYFVSHLYSTLSLLIIKLQKFIFSVHGSLYCHVKNKKFENFSKLLL